MSHPNASTDEVEAGGEGLAELGAVVDKVGAVGGGGLVEQVGAARVQRSVAAQRRGK